MSSGQDTGPVSAPRVWLITGASRGVGLAMVSSALADGDTVVATARRPQALDELVAAYPDRVVALALDITDIDATQVLADLGLLMM